MGRKQKCTAVTNKTTPEQNKAILTLLENLKHIEKLKINKIKEEHMQSGFTGFLHKKISKSMIPKGTNWAWNQSNARIVYALSSSITVTLFKLNPRRITPDAPIPSHFDDSDKPSYKLWIYQLNSTSDNALLNSVTNPDDSDPSPKKGKKKKSNSSSSSSLASLSSLVDFSAINKMNPSGADQFLTSFIWCEKGKNSDASPSPPSSPVLSSPSSPCSPVHSSVNESSVPMVTNSVAVHPTQHLNKRALDYSPNVESLHPHAYQAPFVNNHRVEMPLATYSPDVQFVAPFPNYQRNAMYTNPSNAFIAPNALNYNQTTSNIVSIPQYYAPSFQPQPYYSMEEHYYPVEVSPYYTEEKSKLFVPQTSNFEVRRTKSPCSAMVKRNSCFGLDLSELFDIPFTENLEATLAAHPDAFDPLLPLDDLFLENSY